MFNFDQTNVPAVPDTNMRALPQMPVARPEFSSPVRENLSD
jgi:hypothetical protein